MTRTFKNDLICFAQTVVFKSFSAKIYVFVWPFFSSSASKGREGGFHFIVDVLSFLEPPTHPTLYVNAPSFFWESPSLYIYTHSMRCSSPESGRREIPIYKLKEKRQ